MLLSPNRKKMATLIVKSMKPSYVQKLGEESGTGEYQLPSEDEEDYGGMGLESAMESFLDGVSSKNPKKMADALKDFLELCESGSGEETESEAS